eukprot:CAMPEP_0174695056 /NCGR_PEP_ID=MMETSP1094-20130205/1514_1 /TAXON_ID=156173 /ORGANISM="Chrysochromulina brevifilum, Strain UTEX LB 985" /LENGTH=42 /DNA_ID= /DNA_START= /DNA_END= /DNA_ORIENTATION=
MAIAAREYQPGGREEYSNVEDYDFELEAYGLWLMAYGLWLEA